MALHTSSSINEITDHTIEQLGCSGLGTCRGLTALRAEAGKVLGAAEATTDVSGAELADACQ